MHYVDVMKASSLRHHARLRASFCVPVIARDPFSASRLTYWRPLSGIATDAHFHWRPSTSNFITYLHENEWGLFFLLGTSNNNNNNNTDNNSKLL